MANRTRFAQCLVALVAAALVGGSGLAQTTAAKAHALPLTGEVQGTHDPSIGADHGRYYVFATGAAYGPRPPGLAEGERPPVVGQLPIRCSTDLRAWTRCGAVFSEIPPWIREMSPKTKDLWAPDISFFDGQFHLYYAFSLFGKNTSGIALATNETLDSNSPKYKWVDRGLVLRSTAQDNFNAIDPNVVLDEKGLAWLSFGSFWTGIKMRRLDRRTGLLSQDDATLYSLASRAGAPRVTPEAALPPNTQAIEAPFILRHGKYFYLFTSWDLCCRGLKSTYRTMVGRSKKVTGPYVDRDGTPLLSGGGSSLLSANAVWLGPGGESLIHLPDEDLMIFHAYSAIDGKPAMQISTLQWLDGWPTAALAEQSFSP